MEIGINYLNLIKTLLFQLFFKFRFFFLLELRYLPHFDFWEIKKKKIKCYEKLVKQYKMVIWLLFGFKKKSKG